MSTRTGPRAIPATIRGQSSGETRFSPEHFCGEELNAILDKMRSQPSRARVLDLKGDVLTLALVHIEEHLRVLAIPEQVEMFPATQPEAYTCREAAKVLKFHTETVRLMCQRKELGHTWIKGRIRIPRIEVERLLRRR